MQSLGMAIIVKDAERTIENCIKSFIEHVDQCVVVFGGKSTDNTEVIVRSMCDIYPHLTCYDFDWCKDFSAARNFSFGKLKTDWLCWLDADDWLYHPEEMRKHIANIPDDVGAIWFPYHYAQDEFGNVTTIYERERILRAKCGWIWQNRVHEVVSPLFPCRYVRTDAIINVHDHTGGHERSTRNFDLLFMMQKENPDDRRIELYLGHQFFADGQWLKSADWYMKFCSHTNVLPLEKFQALCYASRALRNMGDNQAAECALQAVSLCPQYKDGYMESAHSFLRAGDYDKAIQFAMLADARDSSLKTLMQETPTVIFVNPLDYTFNRYALLSEAYLKKENLPEALKWALEAQKVRPTPELQGNLNFIQQNLTRKKVYDAIQLISTDLINSSEYFKLAKINEITPFWFRDTQENLKLQAVISNQIKDVIPKNEVHIDGDTAIVNVRNSVDINKLLKDIDKQYKKVKVICSYPLTGKQGNVLSIKDMEDIFISSEKRHLVNLRSETSRIWFEYENTEIKGKFIRMFLGQGLEHWNPHTINNIGCGGSETAAAMVAKRFAEKGHNPILYAMDNQIWDGVMYRSFDRYNPQMTDCDWFISSRVPDIFNGKINAAQKWLWVHDVHCGERLTPEAAAEINVIVALSHWHVDFLKRVYPFLKDAEVVDMDDQDKTYEDVCTPVVFHQDAKCRRLPKIAIIGNGLNTDKFQKTIKKVPHSFIWCSSPDRGLEQLLNLWPGIMKQWPDATLRIFYGWNYFDSSLFIQSQREFKERIKQLVKQPGVQWCNRIGQEELAIELLKAEAMVYPPPHDFRETYGIAFLEAQAAGTIVFYRQNGALGETVGDRGVPLALDMTADKIVETVINTLQDKALCDTLRVKGKEYAGKRSWDLQADKFLSLYGKLDRRS
jgi:glycosyltransferase involved in cell wall biosynthesis